MTDILSFDYLFAPYCRMLGTALILLCFEPQTVRARAEDTGIKEAFGTSVLGRILTTLLLMFFDMGVALRRCRKYPVLRMLMNGYVGVTLCMLAFHLVVAAIMLLGL